MNRFPAKGKGRGTFGANQAGFGLKIESKRSALLAVG